ncbi:hypothetical protein JKP75_13270 [Blastococcus sp. TML/M2B]|nr:hypothetical protein [Blastococcus sp. TML/M2B]
MSVYDLGLDAAACAESTLVPGSWLGPTNPVESRRDATLVRWSDFVEPGTSIWCNPPYSARLLPRFLERMVQAADDGHDTIALLPASVCTRWWNRWVVDGAAEVDLLPGRLRFAGPHAAQGYAPFGAALVRWPARVSNGPSTH